MKDKDLKCLVCGANNIKNVVDLGDFPIATTYSDSPNEKIKKTNLGLSICTECNLIQNSNPVNPADVYNKTYDYITGASIAHKVHLVARINDYITYFNLDDESNVLEVASNDGCFQDVMLENGIRSIGIEPSEVPANVAKAKGHNVVVDFFNTDLVRNLNLEKSINVVIMNNVITHTHNPVEMLIAAKNCLSTSGIVVLECMYLGDQLENHSFETIYHGNYTYLSLYSISLLADRANLEICGAEIIDSHGSSIRVWMKNKCTSSSSSVDTPRVQLLEIREKELRLGYDLLPNLLNKIGEFGFTISKFTSNFIKFINKEIDLGHTIVGYGAAAKTATYISLLGDASQCIQFVCDINENKWGKYFPGTDIEIRNPSVLTENNYTIIVFPWNLFSEIKGQFELMNIHGNVVNIKSIIEGDQHAS